MSRQTLVISFSQLAVYDNDLPNPFPDWTDAHILQGFAWRPHSVSFGTLGDTLSEIEVSIEAAPELTEGAVRAIVLPYEVHPGGITVSSILSDVYDYELPTGHYALWFEAIPLADAPSGSPQVRYRLRFAPADAPVEPRILRQDEELDPKLPLLMQAEAAV